MQEARAEVRCFVAESGRKGKKPDKGRGLASLYEEGGKGLKLATATRANLFPILNFFEIGMATRTDVVEKENETGVF